MYVQPRTPYEIVQCVKYDCTVNKRNDRLKIKPYSLLAISATANNFLNAIYVMEYDTADSTPSVD